MHVFDEMQFVSHCYTVVSYQTIFRHSIYTKNLSSARVAGFFLFVCFFFFFFFCFVFCFCKIREFGSPSIYFDYTESS